jgi:hypothetical protein
MDGYSVKGDRYTAFMVDTIYSSNYFTEYKACLVFLHMSQKNNSVLHSCMFSTTRSSWLMIFNETIYVYSDNYMKPKNSRCGQKRELPILKYVIKMVIIEL